jgi:integrase
LAVADPTWRTIIALARYAGLRCPSEVLSLRWQDVDWDAARIVVQSPKTEHHPGRATRTIPLFHELRPYLEEAFELAPTGAVYVVDARYRDSANTPSGWRNCNLRQQFSRIIRRAGLQPWPRLFHALRSSRETELAATFPLHVVAAWLGNTPRIALKHYLQVTTADFDRAARLPEQRAAKALEQAHADKRATVQTPSTAPPQVGILQQEDARMCLLGSDLAPQEEPSS